MGKGQTVEAKQSMDGQMVLGGYAILYNIEDNSNGFCEVFRPGCFAKSIKNDDIRATWQFNSDYELGCTKAGTLRLYEDEHGLRYELDLSKTPHSDEILKRIENGRIIESGIGFVASRDQWSANRERELLEAKLYEIGICDNGGDK